MKAPRPYIPSATHRALHPAGDLKLCACGVLFKPRKEEGPDDPNKCLTCNRSGWSVLFGFDPKAAAERDEPGEVIPIERAKAR